MENLTIRQLRKMRELNLVDVAKFLDMTVSTIVRKETANRWTAYEAVQLANFFNYPIQNIDLKPRKKGE